MNAPTKTAKLLTVLNDTLQLVGDLILFAILLLVSWKILWGFVAMGIWQTAGIAVFDYIQQWPTWLRLVIGFPTLLLVFFPLFYLAYLLYEKQHLMNLVEIRKQEWFLTGIEPLRKCLYCLAAFPILKTLWQEYDQLEMTLNSMQRILGQIAAIYFG